jgi:menaquinone-dependent protoporphyrinogen IX oxidase
MSGKILAAYASKYGATALIAEKVTLRLVKSGLAAEALPVKEVTSLAEYKAILLGSGVYMGMWLKEGADFLKTHESELAKMPVWFFSDGPTGAGDPKVLMKNWTFPESPSPTALSLGILFPFTVCLKCPNLISPKN